MKAGNLIDIAALITTVALVTVIVTKPNSAGVISSIGKAFAGSLQAAMGNSVTVNK